jgi:hypothetical protein
MKNIIKNTFMAACMLFIMSSCAIRIGTVVPNSHYVYPNSNVTPLGQTSSEIKKTGFLIPPNFKAQDVDRLYNDALAKHAGADVLLDYSVDTKVTTYLIVHVLKTTLVGTAAQMEVGKQDIGKK